MRNSLVRDACIMNKHDNEYIDKKILARIAQTVYLNKAKY